jgi:hypothetical protein
MSGKSNWWEFQVKIGMSGKSNWWEFQVKTGMSGKSNWWEFQVKIARSVGETGEGMRGTTLSKSLCVVTICAGSICCTSAQISWCLNRGAHL